jgi:peptidoglycan/LPS O-acetylase OafA/YrhL
VIDGQSPLGLWPYATFWGNYLPAVWNAYLAQHSTNNLVAPGNAYTVLWSLCVEEHFYLLWPAFLSVVRRWRGRAAIALLICVLTGTARYASHASQYDDYRLIHQLSHYRMDSILWGALGALVVDRLPASARPRRMLILLTLAVVGWLAVSRHMSILPPPSAIGISLGLTLLAVFSTGLLIELVKAPTSKFAGALEWRPLVVLGQLSYGMYLVHSQAIDVGRTIFYATPRQPTLANLLLSYAFFVLLSASAAKILHSLIERPFLRLKERMITPVGR